MDTASLTSDHVPGAERLSQSSHETAGSPGRELRVRAVSTAFRNILLVVFLILVFAVVQTLVLWRVCHVGMRTSTSLEHQGLPTLNTLASLQEHLALYRLHSYEYLFAREAERKEKAAAAQTELARIRTELTIIKALLPDSEGGARVSNLESAVKDLDREYQAVQALVDSDFGAAMKEMDQNIPQKSESVAIAARALKDYGYDRSTAEANATFGSFDWIQEYAIIFGSANILVAFGAVIFVIVAARRSSSQLSEALASLDSRTQELIQDISERKRAEAELETVHRRLLDLSRKAGMAEVATNVLHNVGNVLNSVNTSAALIIDSMRKSKRTHLGNVAAMLHAHSGDLADFLTHDAKGKRLPDFIRMLDETLAREQENAVKELDSLCRNINHIKEIVSKQQSYAKVSGVSEVVQVADLVDDALQMNVAGLARHEVDLIRDYQEAPPINVDKHKVLQVLVNLIRNAKYACDDGDQAFKKVLVRVTCREGRIRIAVIDNGIGIAPENLTRIFAHGFTTRKNGHGFGLHSGALAAKEMGGSLTAESNGLGHGATFTLEIPVGA